MQRGGLRRLREPALHRPSFVQAGGANADYHHSGTECAEQGDNALLPPDWHDLDGDGDTAEPLPVDLDGNPRVVGTVDLGPYERP